MRIAAERRHLVGTHGGPRVGPGDGDHHEEERDQEEGGGGGTVVHHLRVLPLQPCKQIYFVYKH